jgi:hypothetical protein
MKQHPTAETELLLESLLFACKEDLDSKPLLAHFMRDMVCSRIPKDTHPLRAECCFNNLCMIECTIVANISADTFERAPYLVLRGSEWISVFKCVCSYCSACLALLKPS